VNFGILLDASVNASSAHHNTHYDRPLLAMVSGYFYGTNRGITKESTDKSEDHPSYDVKIKWELCGRVKGALWYDESFVKVKCKMASSPDSL
jgi:hypothetical protein